MSEQFVYIVLQYMPATDPSNLKARKWQPVIIISQNSGGERVSSRIPFASQGNDSPSVSILICLLLHLCREADRAHDSVPEFFIEDSFVRIAVILYNLIQTINQRLSRRHVHDLSPEWVACQLFLELPMVNPQNGRELLDIFRSSLRLTVKDTRNSDFVTTKLLADLLKGETLGGFGFEQSIGLYGETVAERRL